jgi:tRNA pseudouridine38-40 synthase
MNYRLTLQYDGTDFHGWQVQAGVRTATRTVQGELTRVLSLLENRHVTVHGAGRTDAGVHAEAQVASVRLEREFSIDKLRAAINGNLAHDLRVRAVEHAPDDFHARFSAIGKTYRYRIFNADFNSPFARRYALYERHTLDFEAMQNAAQLFVGCHDWTAFSAAQTDVASRVRRVTNLFVRERWDDSYGGRIIEITATAEGFLRYMVRSIAGTLIAVGRGEMSHARISEAIATGRRALAGKTAPPNGLTLVKVHYDKLQDDAHDDVRDKAQN